MKKIPTLFKREFGNQRRVKVPYEVNDGLEWVFEGKGTPTEKVDGAACAIIGGLLYKRYDAKHGKTPPEGAIPCQEKPDPTTGHWPHWVRVNPDNTADKWIWAAYCNSPWIDKDGTYEAVGPHFQKNPYGLDDDFLDKHGRIKIHDMECTPWGIKEYLRTHEIEGIVWWYGGAPRCKIKRTDFGFEWPIKKREEKNES